MRLPMNEFAPRSVGPGSLSRRPVSALIGLLMLGAFGSPASAQEVRISDLTLTSDDIPVLLVGYGLVTGLDGTGDRVIGGFSSGHTVRSVANLLRRQGVEVPENVLRTRNVAAVTVTAEVSAYLRPGGRFNVQIASIGDATSLRGGVLYTTPLAMAPEAPPMGVAQGPILISESMSISLNAPVSVETSATMPMAGLLEQPLPVPDFANANALQLKTPNLGTAAMIADAINTALGDGTAQVLDPGSVSFAVPSGSDRVSALTQIGQLRVSPDRVARIVIDARNGTVVAGGDVRVGEAVVSHGGMTLSIGGTPSAGDDPFASAGDLRVQPGALVQDVAAALHAVAAPPEAIAAVFNSLREVGALTAQVTVR